MYNSLEAQDIYTIWFERSGGFAGMSSELEIDSEKLPADESASLKKLIRKSGFFAYQKDENQSQNRVDQFMYTISIETETQKRKIELAESEVPESFRPLLEYLTAKSRIHSRK